MTAQTWLVHLRPKECEELLAGAALGRLAVIVDGRPEIYPVSHVYDAPTGTVLFPTNTGTKLYAAVHWPWVAFEVDGIEPDESSGWSVLVVGRAEEVDDPVVMARAAEQRSTVWRSEDTLRWLRIVPTTMTGRRITAVRR